MQQTTNQERKERRENGKRSRLPAKTSKGIKNSFTCYAGDNDRNDGYFWLSVSSVDLELSVPSSTGEHVS